MEDEKRFEEHMTKEELETALGDIVKSCEEDGQWYGAHDAGLILGWYHTALDEERVGNVDVALNTLECILGGMTPEKKSFMLCKKPEIRQEVYNIAGALYRAKITELKETIELLGPEEMKRRKEQRESLNELLKYRRPRY